MIKNGLRLLNFMLCVAVFSDVVGQSCISTNNNAVINFSCGVACAPLNLQVPDLRTTSDYTVSAIAYNPFPFTSAAPALTVPCSSQDDKFFDTTFLPFSFCFYDSVYTKCVLGTNGVVTFDMSNVLVGNNWDLDPPLPIPATGTGTSGTGVCATPNGTLFPRASIMGPYTDIFPQLSDPLYKIETRVTGTAPCRKYIISFSQVPLFGCSGSRVTSQIVLHENTGIIEIFVQSKPFCSFNGNMAVIGIQDWTRLKGVAPPGRNTSSWTATNEAYRFTPSGGSSRFVISELYNMSGTLVATATTSNTTPGLIDLSFPNVCPAGTSEQFIVRTQYASCLDPATTITTTDTVTVNRTNNLNATTNSNQVNCTNGTLGTITVNVPPGSGVTPYQYSLNGGPLQSSNLFSGLVAGNYTVFATDPNGCSSTLNVTISNNGNLTVGGSTVSTSCAGVNNGSITVNQPAGVSPFQYSLNGGPPQSSNIFSNLAAGSYTVTITNGVGCSGTGSFTVSQGAGLNAGFITVPTTCSGANNGSLTINPTNGTAPYQFSINGGPLQSGNVFSNLASGTYTVTIIDANNCTSNNLSATVPAGAALNASITKTDATCNGLNNGTITVTPTNGTAPYQYSLDNINWQASNVFSGLPSGTYTVYFRDNNSCQNSQSVTITQPTAVNVSVSTSPVSCFGLSDGVISITSSGGVMPHMYSLDGINYQSGNSFTLPFGNYTVYIRDANGCVSSQPVSITQPNQLSVSVTSAAASCNGGADGLITATASGGNGGYQYSINGTNFQSGNTFNVVPGNYTVTVRDSKNCTISEPVVVGLNNNLSITPSADQTICEGLTAQLNVATNGNSFAWTPAGSLNNSTLQNPVASPLVTTQYFVTVTLGQCSGQDTIIVNVNPAPIPDAGPDGDICFGQNYQLQGSGGVQFTWTPATYLSSTSVSNPVSTSPQQTITYSLGVVDANGCASLIRDQVLVNVTPPIIVTTNPRDTVVFAGDQFQILASSIATDYSWSPAAGLSNPMIPNPVLTVTNDVTLNVIATTSAGCRGDGVVNIKVYNGPEIYVPSGFTPNGDGKNDIFRPFPVGIEKLNYFRVYNRWGQLVFATTRLLDGWDGRINGVMQPSGTFVWMVQGVTATGRHITKKGTVMLIR